MASLDDVDSPTINSSASHLRRFSRRSVMDFSSLNKETSSLGVRVTEVEGKLPKASVTGASGRGLKGCKILNKDPDPKNPLEGTKESWTDTVLWNPHLHMEAYYKDFVCVENAKIGNVQLQPQQSWTATQQLTTG